MDLSTHYSLWKPRSNSIIVLILQIPSQIPSSVEWIGQFPAVICRESMSSKSDGTVIFKVFFFCAIIAKHDLLKLYLNV